MKRVKMVGASCLLLPLLACAGYPAPTEKLANSLANIRAAQEVGAANVPQAALHLKLAQEEQAKAQSLVNDGKNEQGDMMTLRANSDAELAVALTRQREAETQAAEITAKSAATGLELSAAPTATGPASYSATTTTTSTTVPATTTPAPSQAPTSAPVK